MGMEEYLKSTAAINSDNPAVRERAHSLIEGQINDIEKSKNIFYFVRDEIEYNIYSPLFPIVASATLENKFGFCIQKSTLLAALARAVNVPSRLGFANIRSLLVPKKLVEFQGTDVLLYHGFAELFLNGRWVKATPSFDMRMCHEYGIVPVEFDGENDAMLHPRGVDGKPHIEYLHHHGSFGDLPMSQIMSDWIQTYGQKYIDSWKMGFPELR